MVMALDMTPTRTLLLAAFGAVCLFVSRDGAHAADVATGKARAAACAGCHGADGVSAKPLVPSLAGEPDDFIQWQLVFFRGGSRKSQVMGPIAKALTDEQIRNLGAYYASRRPPKPHPPVAADALAAAGAKVAAEQHCGSCHGADYSGAGPAARLAGQREDVLLKALRDFKSGVRLGSGVASMSDVAYDLSDQDMRALAHFMATRD